MVATEPVATTFRSPFADIDIPEVPLATFVLSRAHELGSKAALIEASSGRQVTYAQLANGVRRAAFGLHQRGFARSDVLALFTPNAPEFAVAYYAVASLGGTLTTINPLASADELATQLADSGARWMITAPSCLETALRARGKLEAERVFVFGEAAAGAQTFDALLSAEGPVPEAPLDVRSDVVALPYSSGTTGLPKGVMLTHYNLVANLCQMDGIAPVSERDTVIAVLPFFHIYGMEVILHHGLSKGATLIVMSRFELEPFLAALERHAVSRAYLVPPIVLALAKHPLVEQYDLSSLKTIVCAAAPLDAELARACERRIDCGIRQAYGLTECSPITHFVPEGRNKPGSVGPVVRNTEAKIVDVSTGEALGPGARRSVHPRAANHARLSAPTRSNRGHDRCRRVAALRRHRVRG